MFAISRFSGSHRQQWQVQKAATDLVRWGKIFRGSQPDEQTTSLGQK